MLLPKKKTDVNKIKPLLIDQITSRVRWRESIDYMIKQGVNEFFRNWSWQSAFWFSKKNK